MIGVLSVKLNLLHSRFLGAGICAFVAKILMRQEKISY